MNTTQLTVVGGSALTMSSREIAELTGKDHPNVMRDIRGMLEELGEDALRFEDIYSDAYGRAQPCFNLPKDLTITLVAGYNVQMRHAIVKRWQELEAKQAKPAELSRMDILKLAMESEQARIEAEYKLALAAPKVEFVDRYVQASSGALGFRQVCKTLCLNEKWLADFLIERQIMYRLAGKLTPYQQHIQAGRFEVKTGVSGGGHGYVQPKFTPKGVQWLAAEMAKIHAAKQMQQAADIA